MLLQVYSAIKLLSTYIATEGVWNSKAVAKQFTIPRFNKVTCAQHMPILTGESGDINFYNLFEAPVNRVGGVAPLCLKCG